MTSIVDSVTWKAMKQICMEAIRKLSSSEKLYMSLTCSHSLWKMEQ